MTECLDDIQLEDALCGQCPPTAREHLAQCAACSRRLAEAQALRVGLRQAFAGVHAPAALVERIREQTVGATRGDGASAAPAVIHRLETCATNAHHPWARRHWSWLAAAAGIMILASLGIVWQLSTPSPVAAAEELVKLHEQNLAGNTGMVAHESHDQDEAYLSDKLGYKVEVPHNQGELRMKGCCVARFLGKQAGNVVVEGPRGRVSIIVSDVNARRLMTREKIVRDGSTFWVCPMKGFYTIAVEHDGLIYCAVGDDTPGHLVDILADILRQHGH